MPNAVEMLMQCNNVDFEGYAYCEQLEREMQVFVLNEPSVEEWNAKAEKQNTKMFIQIKKRVPKDYEEVNAWVHSYTEKGRIVK